MTLLEKLQEIQKYSQLSVRGLAIRCGLKQQTLDKHIKGVAEPSANTLLKICLAFPEISAEWLMRDEGEMIRKPQSASLDIDRIATLVDTIATLQEALNEKTKTIQMLTDKINQLNNK